mgnify:FL=1
MIVVIVTMTCQDGAVRRRHTEGVNVMGEVRNRNIRIGIVDNDPYALKVFGALIERMSSDFAVI